MGPTLSHPSNASSYTITQLQTPRLISGGDIFDVSHKANAYGKGHSYNIFTGKDGSRGLRKSSLKAGDAVVDYSMLDDKERHVLDDWHSFFFVNDTISLDALLMTQD